jgi:hypothetical protein
MQTVAIRTNPALLEVGSFNAGKIGILSINLPYIFEQSWKLKAHKIGKEFRISKDEFEWFLKNTSTK